MERIFGDYPDQLRRTDTTGERRARPLQTGGRKNEMADTGARNHLLVLGRSRYGTHEMRR